MSKKNWERLSTPWLDDCIRISKLERKYWKFINDEFPKRIQTRIKRLKEKKGKIARSISAQEIGNGTDGDKRQIISEYNIQIRECQKILDALRQETCELVGTGSNSPYPPTDEILEVKE